MAKDVLSYCKSCEKCQQAKLVILQQATSPLGPLSICLQVPMSTRNNHYLLIVQDYFTKWVEAVPLPNQTAPLS